MNYSITPPRWRARALAASLFFVLSGSLQAGELLLFPALTLSRSYDNKANMDAADPMDPMAPVDPMAESTSKPAGHDEKEREFSKQIDIFYTADHGKLRLLFEALISDEHRTVERMHAGWRFDGNNTLWVGGYHNPLGYWNTQYHHGQHLQTPIRRPMIVAYEHDNGILPMHVVGSWFEGGRPLNGEGILRYDVAAGVGPRLEEEEGLEHVAVQKPRSYGKLTMSTRLTYFPDATAETQAGVALGSTRIPISGMEQTESRLKITGAFVNWEGKNIRLLGELFHIRDEVIGMDETMQGSFISGYGQLEYRLTSPFTLFGRLEATAGGEDDPYLALSPGFSKKRQVIGIRYDLTHNQALTLEGYRETPYHEPSKKKLNLQWSGTFSF